MRIVFMGTPDFASSALKGLVEAGNEVVLAVTQPDRPKGRGKETAMSAVKECALHYGIEVFQPEKVKEEEAVRKIRDASPDLIVVAAFGQILTKEILDIPRYGCINIHASLLPEYRGASPIQRSIEDGKKETGITIMQMDEGLDTGDILMQQSLAIAENETGGSLFDRLSGLGASLVCRVIPMIEKGEINPVKQDDEKASYVGMLKKDSGRIDFNKSAKELERLVRAMDPWPGTFTFFKGKNLKIWKTRVEKGEEDRAGTEPGTVISAGKNGIAVQCGSGVLLIEELQLSGKKRMKTGDFLLGTALAPGEKLG